MCAEPSTDTMFASVHPRAPNDEIGRSCERMLQSTSMRLRGEKELEKRLERNLERIKSSNVRGRRAHSAEFLLMQDALNYLAILLTIVGFGIGVYTLLFSKNWLLNFLSVVLLAYVKIVSFLVHHELAHGNVFKSRRKNQNWGRVMDVINGSQYWTFEELQRQHIEHHQDKVDYVSFDAAKLMKRLPRPVEVAIIGLEYAYIPVLAYVTHWRSVTAVYWHPERRHARLRTSLVIGFRGGCYMLFGWWNWKGLMLYFISDSIFINWYRILDCFSHTFEELPVGSDAPKGLTAAYEQNRTVSLMATRERRSILNLLYLNFGYHGAHHVDPTGPWLGYAQLDEMIFEGCGSKMPRHVGMWDLVKHFHKERLRRIYNEEGMGVPAVDGDGNLCTRYLFGVLDPSILMLEIAPLAQK